MSGGANHERWLNEAKRQLLGRKIVLVRYMLDSEMKQLGWYHRPVVMQLDNGNLVWPSQDDEGNNGGALFTNDEKQPVLPVL